METKEAREAPPAGRVLRVPHFDLGEHTLQLISLFEEEGFTIGTGPFHGENPWEIGIHARPEIYAKGVRNMQLAYTCGIEMPRRVTLHEILRTSEAIVAKFGFSHRGKDIWLLKTPQQKIRFLTWALLGENVRDLPSQDNPTKIIERLQAQVGTGNFIHRLLNERHVLRSWTLQEYIEPPTSYDTSCRIVADFWGNIHYGLISRSASERGTRKVNFASDVNPLEAISHPRTPLDFLLIHPDSPFFLDTYNITSNRYQGGKALFLNGQPLKDEVDRDVARALGVDPDYPQIPWRFSIVASKMGMLSRGDYPFIGCDFMIKHTGEDIFLEANRGPGLEPEGVGLDPSASVLKCQAKIVRDIVSRIPNNYG